MGDFFNDFSRLALNTATLGHIVAGKGAGWNPHQVIDVCCEKGIPAITFWIREFNDLSHATEVGRYAHQKGISIAGLCRTPYLIGPEAPQGSEELSTEFCKTIRYASELEAEVVTIVVGGYDPKVGTLDDNLDFIADVISKHADRASEEGVKLAIEPLHPVYCGNRSCLTTVRDAITLVENIDHPSVGLAIDVYHVWWDTAFDSELLRIFGKNLIFGAHLCDWLRGTSDILFDRGMMGDGIAEIRRIRDTIEKTGYDGFYEVEVFSQDNWWKQHPHTVLDTLKERFLTAC